MNSSSSTGAPAKSTSRPVSHAGGTRNFSILPLVNRRSIATSRRPITCVLLYCFGTALRAGGAPPRPRAIALYVCFGTALRAGGAPPLYPAFVRLVALLARDITEGTPSPPHLPWPSAAANAYAIPDLGERTRIPLVAYPTPGEIVEPPPPWGRNSASLEWPVAESNAARRPSIRPQRRRARALLSPLA